MLARRPQTWWQGSHRRHQPRGLCSLLQASSNLFSPVHSLPEDVDPDSGLCGEGLVKIAESKGKGLGAFSVRGFDAGCVLPGEYRGELLTLNTLHMRYGDSDPIGGDAAWEQQRCEWRRQWMQERQQRGVGVSGRYCFKFGLHPNLGTVVVLDAEDPDHANWTRFLNHSSADPNLTVQKSVNACGHPMIHFAARCDIAPAAELLFDYGPAYGRHFGVEQQDT